jgi:type II secretion system protein H
MRPYDPTDASRDRAAGSSLLELLVVLTLLCLVAVLAVPPLLSRLANTRLRLASAELAGSLRLARSYAVRHGTHVAVKFYVGDERVRFAIYRDGNDNGVRTRDLEQGVDVLLVPARDLGHLGRHVRFGFPPGKAPRDPSDPRRRLDRLDDPIRFNQSDLASFSPIGAATPGSLYLTDGQRLALVRVYNRTGKLKLLLYDPLQERWR